jgi:hypothetical protein
VPGYRIPSAAMGVAYIGLAASIIERPPAPPVGRNLTVFDGLAPSSVWAYVFTAAAVVLIAASAAWPKAMLAGHTFLLAITPAYGFANLGVSVINRVGWQIAALCAALTAAHVLAILRRPLEAGHSGHPLAGR